MKEQMKEQMNGPAQPSVKWSCQVGESGAAPDARVNTLANDIKGLTVGQRFHLSCSGPEVAWKKETLILDLAVDKTTPAIYQLKLLHVETLEPGHLEAVVTSYLVGQHDAAAISLTDGANTVKLEGFTFDVQSVIKAEQGQEVQPFGPVGPFWLGLSWFVIAMILVGLLTALWVGIRGGRRVSQRRKLLREIATFKTPRAPIDELFRELRQMDKQFDFSRDQKGAVAEELDKSFRLFLLREFMIPAHEWSPREILREMKKYHRPIYNVVRTPLSQAFIELTKARGNAQLKGEDIKQISTLVRQTAERLAKEQVLRAKASRRGVSA